MELRLPEHKLFKLKELLAKHLQAKKISKFDLESLGGLLSHCAHVVRGGKIFCKRVYSLYKELLQKGKKSIRIPSETKADIKWWSNFCTNFNGVAQINSTMHKFPIVSDSSFKGFAAYMGKDWFAGMWSEEVGMSVDSSCGHLINAPPLEVKDLDPNINVYELWPVVWGLKRWAPELKNKSILLFTDNTQVLYMLLKGRSSNITCMSWLRELFWICIIYNIEILPRYINTHCNLVADTLSRLHYFESREEISSKIGGSDLCCKELLFDNYRSARGGVGKESSVVS